MTVLPGLARRNKGYIIRRRVPTDLLATYGKREEVIGLGTRDFDLARQRWADKYAEIERKFAAHRSQLRDRPPSVPAASTAVRSARQLTEADLRRLADEHFADVVDSELLSRHRALSKAREEPAAFWRGAVIPIPDDIRRDRKGRPYSFWQDVWLADGESSLEGAFLYAVQFNHRKRLARLERLHSLADYDFLELTEHVTGLADDERVRLAGRLMLAEISALKAILTKDETRLRAITGGEQHSAAPTQAQRNGARTPVYLLSQAAHEWIRDKEGAWTLRRRDDCRRAIDLFLQVVPDKPITDYGKADALEFKKLLREMPANRTKNPVLRDLSVHEGLAQAKAKGLPPMSVTNVNKLLTIVGSLFNWMRGHYDQVTANPFDKMTIAVKSNAREERDPFTAAELSAIFSAPVFRGCGSPAKWSEPGPTELRGSAKFWIPSLGSIPALG